MGSVLELVRDGTVTRVLPLGDEPVSVGAHLGNRIAIDAADVSARHAVIAPGPDGLMVVDLGSTNGTWVNEVRVAMPTLVRGGDVIRIGGRVELRVRAVDRATRAQWALREEGTGLSYSLRASRTVIGSGERCHIRLADGPKKVATLVVHDDEVWLSTAHEERELDAGERFEVADRAFVLTEISRRPRQTLREVEVDESDESVAYHLRVSLDSAGGPTALIRCTRTEREHLVTAENRATLLYLLARRRRRDLDQGEHDLTAGWCDDEEVAVGVWGRAAWEQSASRFSVLIHRVRKEIEEGGFDPWFIEKRRGATRVALAHLEVL